MSEPTIQRMQTYLCASCMPVLACGIVLFLLAPTSDAREQAEEFLKGLQERGLHGLALDYLLQMESSSLTNAEFRERIPYHRGVTLIAQARQTPDIDQRATLLSEAWRELNQFATAQSDSPATADALVELSNVLVDQAMQLLAQAADLPDEPTYVEQRKKMLRKARELLADAQPRFRQAEQFYSAALDRMPKTLDPKTQGELIAQRQEFRARVAQVGMLAAQAQFEAATTYPTDSKEFMEQNRTTAKILADLYEKYSRWLIGFHARLYEGRCYQAIGDYQRALGCYEELILQSSVHPAFRKLIASAYAYQAQCLMAQNKHDAAIANLTGWLKAIQGEEATMPEWLLVRYELAQALRTKAESSDTKPSKKRKLLSSARDAYRLVAEEPNQNQNSARAALAMLGSNERLASELPRDFSNAYSAGKDAMTSLNAAKMAIPSASKNNPAAIPQLRLQAEQGLEVARRNFRIALSLAKDETDRDQLNEVRYFLCWLDWEAGDYYQAAILGSFLAQRYPEHPAAAAAAKLALASFERLQQEAAQRSDQRTDTEFEARKMAELAEFMTRRWPGTPTAETAYRVLVNYAIQANRIDEAKGLLDEIAAASRPAFEAQLGNAMWGRYLELSQQAGSSAAELQTLRDDSIKLMQNGVEAARKSRRMTPIFATSSLYLAQSLLSDEKYAEAIALLEEKQIGPLMLVRERHIAATRPEYIAETYKAALRAYVSVSPPNIPSAIKALKGLETTIAAIDEGQSEHLMRVYVSLAKSLHEQLEQLRASGRENEAANLSLALGEFLDRIADGQAKGNWSTRFWIAQTYYSLGASLQQEKSSTSSIPKRYFDKAHDLFESLAVEGANDPGSLPQPAAMMAVQKQLGECYRELGGYQKALDAFSIVLAEQESQLAVQQAAAQTYQRWGEASGGIKKLERAIHGGFQVRSTGKNRFWGWLKLALVAERAARSDPKYKDVFFHARLEAARCRYLIGIKSQGEARKKHLATAKQSVRSMLQLYPELGGENWRGQFEFLLRQIQKSSGESPTGLKEFSAAKM